MSVHDMGTTSGFQANQGVKRGNSLGVRPPRTWTEEEEIVRVIRRQSLGPDWCGMRFYQMF
ncbi:hypothetical protein QJS10_CPA02g01320 [Acorus calamus]|uniref:Uncharacterized protein n=1 Tax=Acorus calamus TaxID=4465 RepID=A0AAV9FDF1_ACOCL|nr:hypothetical protein QJS10_CPA02g01320 [Acorus calamus]